LSLKAFRILLFFIFVIELISCQVCEEFTEPTLTLEFENEITFEKIYGIGGTSTFKSINNLPLAINSDTTIYIFYHENKIDTLGISYNRNILFDSEYCGFAITLDSFTNLDISTFDNISISSSNETENIIGKSKQNEYKIIIHN
jgi:hypothetical protein